VLGFQLLALGLLATGALGTSNGGTRVAATPRIVSLTDAAHDTSVPLMDAPVVPNDPNRVIPELERQLQPTVATQTHDAATQTAVGALLAPATTTSFVGLSLSDLTTGYIPPDPVGDVGLNQYVQAVNGGLSVFSKTGDNLTGAINDSSFWSGLAGCETTLTRGLTDPTVNYDQFNDRWVYSELSVDLSTPTWGQSYMCVAVSTTDDATDTWNRYAFAAGNGLPSGMLTDYPKLGIWPDGYYLSFNDFDNSAPHNFVGAGVMALERSAMLSGASAQSIFIDLRGVAGVQSGGILPGDADGPTLPPNGAPDYYVAPVDDPVDVNDQMGVWEFHVDWAVPSNSKFWNPQALQVAAFNGLGYSVPQPGTGQLLDGIADGRLMNRLQYRNFGGYETLVTNLTVDNGSGANAPRWFELRKNASTWSVNQESTFSPDSVNRWMGSVAMDGAGDIALGYSAGDAATFPGLRYTGRLVGDALSTMQAESILTNGGGSQTGTSRWGDYSQMTVDPADDCTFWYAGEYFAATSPANWTTRIGSFRFPGCSATRPTYSVVPAISGTDREGQTLATTDGTWSPAPTSTAYRWRRCDSTSISCVDIPGAVSSTYVLQPADAGRRLRVKVTVTAANGTGSVVSAPTGTVLPLAPVNSVLPSVIGTAQVAQTVSTDNGTWSTYASVTNIYSYQWQRCAPGCGTIPGATNQNYKLQAADAGARMQVGVTVTTIGGATGPKYSAQSGTVALPPAPTNVVAPTISGTPQEGQTLTAHTGSWVGVAPITYTYQWKRCDSSGANCVAVTGQVGPTYIVPAGDLGKQILVTVTAQNSGGASSYDALAVIIVLPGGAGGGGSGGTGGSGGSGGGAGAPDLQVTGFASAATPAVGDLVSFALTVTDANLILAQSVVLTVTLPSGLQFVSGSADRGSGCSVTTATKVSCNLDFLSTTAPRANVQILARVITTGQQILTATVTAQQGLLNTTKGTVSVSVVVPVAKTTAGGTTTGPPTGLNGSPKATPDKKKPTSHAIASKGTRGQTAKLRFRTYDDRGVAKAVATVKRNGKVYRTAKTGFGPVAYGSTYFVGWHIAANAPKGRYTFCVVATDRAGNHSPSSCAALILK
jgi:uncharacterized repeat protein (TIGR01451 family)